RNPLQDRLIQSVKSVAIRADQVSAFNATSGYALDPVPRLPLNPWKVRVHMSATQSVPGTGEPATVVNLNTVDFDSANGFDTTTHQYTIPVSGYYQVNAKCHMTVGVWGYVEMIGRVYQNGVRISEGFQTNAGDFTSIGGGGFITQTG